jgi:hypothetical protein
MAYITVRRWAGSLATSLDEEQLQPGDFVKLENFIYDSNGLPVVRGGRRCWNSLAMTGDEELTTRALYNYRGGWVTGRMRNRLVAYAGGLLRVANDKREWTTISDAFDETASPSMSTIRGLLIVAIGSSKQSRLYAWDGKKASIEVIPSSPQASVVATHGSRLWVVSREYPSRIWYSAPLDPYNWNTSDVGGAGWIEVDPGDGNEISALVPGFLGDLVVFKDGPNGGSTYVIQGYTSSTFTLKPLTRSVGAVSRTACSQIGDTDIIFASRRGIHTLSRTEKYGDLESGFVDNEVSGRWRSLSNNQKRNAVCVDDYPNDMWWLFVDMDGDGVNDHGWLFNYRRNTSRGFPSVSDVTYGSHAAVVFNEDGSGKDELITGGIDDGSVYSEHNPEAIDTSVDGAETDVEWSVQLAPMDAGDGFVEKSWNDLWLSHDNWGLRDMTLSWWGDNHPQHSETMTMNPADAPTIYSGARYGEIRGLPSPMRVGSGTLLREGGKSINLKLSGSGSRIRLRAMRLGFTLGRMDLSADRYTPYVSTRAQWGS